VDLPWRIDQAGVQEVVEKGRKYPMIDLLRMVPPACCSSGKSVTGRGAHEVSATGGTSFPSRRPIPPGSNRA